MTYYITEFRREKYLAKNDSMNTHSINMIDMCIDNDFIKMNLLTIEIEENQ